MELEALDKVLRELIARLDAMIAAHKDEQNNRADIARVTEERDRIKAALTPLAGCVDAAHGASVDAGHRLDPTSLVTLSMLLNARKALEGGE